MAWDDDPYDSSLISSIDPRISGNPYIDEAAGLRIQNQYLDQQRRQNQQGGFGQALTQEAERNGLDPDVLQRIIKIESGGDPNNRTGSYKGLFQLSDQEFKKYGGGNVFDPTDNIRAGTAKLAAERDAFKEKYGRDPSPTDLYLTHQQGEGGYGQHMANPDRPAWENMFNTGEGRQKGAGWAKQAIWGNIPDQYKKQFGSVDNVTSADFVNMWRNKVEGDNPGVMADGPATGSPAGNPVQADELGSVAALPYGRRTMDETQQQPPGLFQSLFGGLGGGQQQGGQQQPGLLGALSDPETMGYLGMMVKALSPYSNVDPQGMLKLAQAKQKEAQDLTLRQQQLQLNTRAQDRAEMESERPQYITRPDGSIVAVPRQGGSPTIITPGVKDLGETAKQKDYAFAVKQGYKGSFEEFNALTSMSPEKSQDSIIGKKLGEEQIDIQKQGFNASAQIAQLNQMEKLMDTPGFRTGSGAGFQQTLQKAWVAMGGDPKAPASVEAFNALAQKSVVEDLGSLGTGISNADRDFLSGTAANIANTPEGNRQIIAVKRALAERKKEMALLARDYAKSHNGRLDVGFYQAAEDYAQKNPMFKDVPAPAGGSGPSAAPASAPAPAPASAPSSALNDARTAIQRGAPRDKVIERLRSMGIDPGGL